MKEENDIELCTYRAQLRDAYSQLDILQRDGELDSLWIAYHRISNAAEKAKERLNRIKYGGLPCGSVQDS